jgi:formiminoglutamate deiminase
MYRFLDRLTPVDVEAIAAQAYVEMLESGFTAVAEFHYLHHAPDGRPYASLAEMAERIASAAGETGIGLTLLPVAYRFGGFGAAAPAPGQRRFLNDPDRFAQLVEASRAAVRNLPDARVGVAPHSLRAIAPEDIAPLARLASDAPVHIHAAEQEKEVADCLAWSGQRPIEWLLDRADLDARWCVVHATHMTDAETRALAARGAVAGLCPITEANLGDGLFPAVAYRAAAGAFGIGSDSNVLIDAAEELRTLEYGQRLRDRRRNRLAPAGASVGRTLFEGACAGGARACGRRIGALAPGRRADIVVLDRDHPALLHKTGDAVLDGWIFAARASAVRDVIVGGRHVVADGRHVARAAVRARFAQAIARLLT